MSGMVAALPPLQTRVQHPMASKGLGVVLDPHRGGFGGAQGVDAAQVRERAVVHGQGLRDLEESDQLEPIQTLGAWWQSPVTVET